MYFLCEELRLRAFDLRLFGVLLFIVHLPGLVKRAGEMALFDLYYRSACSIMYLCYVAKAIRKDNLWKILPFNYDGRKAPKS